MHPDVANSHFESNRSRAWPLHSSASSLRDCCSMIMITCVHRVSMYQPPTFQIVGKHVRIVSQGDFWSVSTRNQGWQHLRPTDWRAIFKDTLMHNMCNMDVTWLWIRKRVWIGIGIRMERRSSATDFRWSLSLQKGVDRGYGSPVRPGYGSGPYILSYSHICSVDTLLSTCKKEWRIKVLAGSSER